MLSYLTQFLELSCDILPFASFFKKKSGQAREDGIQRGGVGVRGSIASVLEALIVWFARLYALI